MNFFCKEVSHVLRIIYQCYLEIARIPSQRSRKPLEGSPAVWFHFNQRTEQTKVLKHQHCRTSLGLRLLATVRNVDATTAPASDRAKHENNPVAFRLEDNKVGDVGGNLASGARRSSSASRWHSAAEAGRRTAARPVSICR